jgi:hypothetical protein
MAIHAKVSAAFFPEPGLVAEPEPQHRVALHSIAVVSRVGSCATEPQVAASEIESICEALESQALKEVSEILVWPHRKRRTSQKKGHLLMGRGMRLVGYLQTSAGQTWQTAYCTKSNVS